MNPDAQQHSAPQNMNRHGSPNIQNDSLPKIQKYLASLGLASRREVEAWISAGRVTLNGKRLNQQGVRVEPGVDRIEVDGKLVEQREPPKVYWLLHKPDQTLCSRKAQTEEQATIYDLPRLQKVPFRFATAGRLDYRTEGLLLLSNDGELIHKLTHPSYKIPRHYYVLVKGKLSDAQLDQLKKGIDLDDGPVRKVDIVYAHGKNLGRSRGSWYIVTVYEGRNRLVRRIFEALGHDVVRLIRYGMGPLRLPETLKAGDYIQLSAKQLKQLRDAVNSSSRQS